jgi:hypothetical protein
MSASISGLIETLASRGIGWSRWMRHTLTFPFIDDALAADMRVPQLRDADALRTGGDAVCGIDHRLGICMAAVRSSHPLAARRRRQSSQNPLKLHRLQATLISAWTQVSPTSGRPIAYGPVHRRNRHASHGFLQEREGVASYCAGSIPLG